ncbi:CHAT domain-containing protein [Haloferula sp.]|uniref:CHAT domain-containing protein n=1 Tax=Haloferula sp. TaxID=2497595 RepID=UPI00329C65BD
MIRLLSMLLLLGVSAFAEDPGALAARGDFSAAAEGFLEQAREAEKKGSLDVATPALMNAASCMKMSGDISAASLHADTVRLWLGETPEANAYLEWLALKGSILALGKNPSAAVPKLTEALGMIDGGRGDDALEVDVLNDLGIAQSASGEHAAAMVTFDRAAKKLASNNGSTLRARQNHLVAAYQAWTELELLLERVQEVGSWTGDLEQQSNEAREKFESSLAVALSALSGYDSKEILAMHLRLTAAMASQRAGRVSKASALYGESLRIARDLGSREFEASALLGLAEQYQDAGRHKDALELLEATRLIEGDIGPSQQARLEVLTAESRFALSPKADATGNAIRLAIAAVESIRSDLARSQLVSDLGRGFREFSGRPYLLLADHLLLLAGSDGQDDLRAARDAIEGFKTWELNDFYRDDCVNLALEQARNLDELGDPEVAVVYIIPLDTRTELLVGHDSGLRRFTSPVGSEELLSTARQFRYHLESDYGTYRYLTEAEALYGNLIKPLAGHLQGLGVKHLVFVPDGALGNIPLGVLFDPARECYLLEDYSVSIAPNLSLLGEAPDEGEDRPLLAGGLSESVQGYPAIPAVDRELTAVSSIYPKSVMLKNGKFTSDAVRKNILDLPVDVVHLASHGEFLGRAEGCFLLTHDGRITLDELEGMIRPKKYVGLPVELLCLSACRTAAGDDRSALGLAGAAVKSGSRSVIATLWYVDDNAASDVMTRFHRTLMESPKIGKAEALRRSQLYLLNQDRNTHPNLWAPFVLIGNWQ